MVARAGATIAARRDASSGIRALQTVRNNPIINAARRNAMKGNGRSAFRPKNGASCAAISGMPAAKFIRNGASRSGRPSAILDASRRVPAV